MPRLWASILATDFKKYYLLFSEKPGLDGEEPDDKEGETRISNANWVVYFLQIVTNDLY